MVVGDHGGIGAKPSLRNISRLEWYRFRIGVAVPITSEANQSMRMPSSARAVAGASTSSHERVPKRSSSTRMPSTCPGTATAVGPSEFRSSTTSGQGNRSEDSPLPDNGYSAGSSSSGEIMP